ncbi:MAG: spermidine synthase [Nitratireductor sp.]|nr:spermidine synthase [Nitratireductor sp.]
MIAWEHLASAEMPGGGALKLMRRGKEYSIKLDRVELMNSRLSGSEEALATMALERIGPVAAPHVLIGGLGMGFTLRAALAVFPSDARITVAELSSDVVEWARGPMAELFGSSMDDPRVTIHVGDVGPFIAASKSGFDAILLDVDNGPEGISRAENDAIYSAKGLAAAKAALRPGGVLGVWSQGPDAAFHTRMKQSGLVTDEVRVKANAGRKGARHVIWFGMKRPQPTRR